MFFIGTGDANVTQFAVGNSFDVIPYADYLVPKGAAPYDPDRSDRNLQLGATQQWELRSYSVSHPFHIHVNPFQIVRDDDPNGKDVSLPGVTEADGDNQFAGLSGAWKDTIFVKTNLNPGQLTNPPKDYYRVVVRTRYQRYIGTFVLHCHILDHRRSGHDVERHHRRPMGSGAEPWPPLRQPGRTDLLSRRPSLAGQSRQRHLLITADRRTSGSWTAMNWYHEFLACRSSRPKWN